MKTLLLAGILIVLSVGSSDAQQIGRYIVCNSLDDAKALVDVQVDDVQEEAVALASNLSLQKRCVLLRALVPPESTEKDWKYYRRYGNSDIIVVMEVILRGGLKAYAIVFGTVTPEGKGI